MQIAEGALFLFVQCFQDLYGLRYCTLNLHQLVHLVDCVKQTGPLFVNNCFIFEDLNGFIVKHIHGTQGIDTQLVNIVVMLKVTPLLYEKHLKTSENDDVHQLYLELSDSVLARHTFQEDIETGIRPIGNFNLITEDFHMASKCGVTSENVKQFFKVIVYKGAFYIYGAAYKRLSKRQQHIATFVENNSVEFCSVQYFIQSNSNGIVNLAPIEPFQKLESFGSIWQVTTTNSKKFTPVSNYEV